MKRNLIIIVAALLLLVLVVGIVHSQPDPSPYPTFVQKVTSWCVANSQRCAVH